MASERRWRPLEVIEDMPGYVLIGKTISNSSGWAFDRLRMYSNSLTARVALTWGDGTVIDIQPFSTTGDFEHDFLFDLSSNVDKEEILILLKGASLDKQDYTEVYMYPTGFDATRGKNAEITYWDLNYYNPINDGHSSQGYFEAKGQPLNTIVGAEHFASILVNITNCNVDSKTIDKTMISLDRIGQLGGTFQYLGNTGAPTGAVLENYNNLVAKGWNIEGIAPPAPYPAVTSYFKFDEAQGNDYYDSSLLGNTATRYAGDVSTDGILNNAYKGLGNNSDYVLIPYISEYNFKDSENKLKPHTFSFWFKTDHLGVNTQQFIDKKGQVYVAMYNGTLRWIIQGGTLNSMERRSYNYEFAPDTWYCVSLVFDGTPTLAGMKMYVNGVTVPKSTTKGGDYGDAVENTNDFFIGNDHYLVYSRALSGLMDELAISIGYAWNEGEVSKFYNNGVGTPYN